MSSRSWAPRVAIAIVLSAVMASSSAATWTQNDAGSGTDAPASVAEALELLRLGGFIGNFTPTDTADAYFHKTSQSKGPTCTTATAVSDLGVRLHLAAITRGVAREIEAGGFPGQPTTLALATDGFKGAFVQASLDTIPTVMPLRYDLQLQSRRLVDSNGDAGTGADAPSTTADAPSVSAAGCHAGRIGGADTTDTYRVSLPTSSTLLVSLAGEAESATLELRNAAGDVLGVVPSGAAVPMSLPPGDLTLVVSSGGAAVSSVYALATGGIGTGPPGRPCEPACLDLVFG